MTEAIHERLVALCLAQSEVTTAEAWWPDDEVPFTAAELPAVIVYPMPRQDNTILSGSDFALGQDWGLSYLIARFPKDYKLRDRETWDLIRPFTLSVPDYFNAHRSLSTTGVGPGLASKITLPSVYTLAPATFDRAMYAAVGFRMTVYTIHSR